MNRKTREISVFVDESGSFAPESADPASRYYLLCFVAHDQEADISAEVTKLEDELEMLGLGREHCVHAGPLIRREDDYEHMTREERRSIFQRMLIFARSAEVSYKCFAVDKHQNSKETAIHDVLLQSVVEFLIARRGEFESYDKLKVYYDNGQSQVLSLLKEAFAIYASKTEFVPAVKPENYRLFQAADLACTLALVRAKLGSEGRMSLSENAFFGGEKQLRKGYLKPIERKEWR